ncbi:MAG: DUF1735 domain-containing protein [Cytophagaceae bacterium]|nr:DUF1735 domain-containing protein [Cytophagaceae bacterium]
MKKHFVKILVAFVLPFFATSCIEDNLVKLTDQGSMFISTYFPGKEKKATAEELEEKPIENKYRSTANKLYFSPFKEVKKVDLLNIRRNVPSEAVLQTSTTVKLIEAPEILDTYNEENETNFEWLPSSIFNLSDNPGVTVAGKEVTINFGSGDFAKDLTINLDGSKWDLAKKYAVAYKITDTGNGKLSGDDYIITLISVKNKWDGIYDVTSSTMVDVTNAAFTSAFTSGESYQYALETVSPTQCVIKDNTFGLNAPFFIFYTGSGLSYYGAFGLIVEFDPATDKIVAVTNYHGQPAANTRAALLEPTGTNAYNNGTIDIKWHMTQSSVVAAAPHIRTTWTETWKYAKAR